MLTKLTPNIMVEDVDATVEFYRYLLGFDLVHMIPGPDRSAWASMKSGDVEINFQVWSQFSNNIPDYPNQIISGAFTFYFATENVKGLYERIKDKVYLVQDLHTTFYGIQAFAIKDCNGLILAFASPVEG
jgi:uncharacterized glyoxalase superfamily protein PhnB